MKGILGLEPGTILPEFEYVKIILPPWVLFAVVIVFSSNMEIILCAS